MYFVLHSISTLLDFKMISSRAIDYNNAECFTMLISLYISKMCAFDSEMKRMLWYSIKDAQQKSIWYAKDNMAMTSMKRNWTIQFYLFLNLEIFFLPLAAMGAMHLKSSHIDHIYIHFHLWLYSFYIFSHKNVFSYCVMLNLSEWTNRKCSVLTLSRILKFMIY